MAEVARLPRLVVPQQPHHVVQRGNNGQAIVQDDEDRRRWLVLLGETAATHGLAVHAYALLDNHYRLLVTPREPEALSRAMQALGRRYVADFNRRHRRTGTLWDGRFRGGIIEPDPYLLACMCFIESGPLHAGGTLDDPWSSAAHHLGRRRDAWITDHPLYWALGNTPFDRQAAYRVLLEQGIPGELALRFDQAAQQGWALGSAGFLERLGAQTDRPLLPRPRGRPRRQRPPAVRPPTSEHQ
jgi:putative transposase